MPFQICTVRVILSQVQTNKPFVALLKLLVVGLVGASVGGAPEAKKAHSKRLRSGRSAL